MGNDHSPPLLCALMRTRTRKLGVIYAEIPLLESGFAPKHLDYMAGIAGLASSALRQAKAFEYRRTEGQRAAVFTQSGFAAEMNAHGVVGDDADTPLILGIRDRGDRRLDTGGAGHGGDLRPPALRRHLARVLLARVVGRLVEARS